MMAAQPDPAAPAPPSAQTPDTIAAWLADHGGKRADPGVLVGGLCERLLAVGVALWRVSYGHPTQHPQLCGSQVVWRRDSADVLFQEYPRGHGGDCLYLDGPARLLQPGADRLRRGLDGPFPKIDFDLVRNLASEGATEYTAMALPFSSGRTGFVSWTSDRPGGFGANELALLDRLLPLIALRLELEASYNLSSNLMETYLGRDAAHRVLAGQIERGSGTRVRAAILLSELRGFTAMSERLPSEAVIAYLDSYFDAVGRQVARHGGEILEFIGDGVLAAFDIDDESHGAACCQALHAAIAVLHPMAALNRCAAEPLDVVVALHLGNVFYGNIGAADRLDFTVIGPTVNESSRIEGLCKALDRPLLTSASFAESCTCEPLVSLGHHALRGVPEPREIFTLPPDRLPAPGAYRADLEPASG